MRLPAWDVLLVSYLEPVCLHNALECVGTEYIGINDQMSTNEGILLKRQSVNDIG